MKSDKTKKLFIPNDFGEFFNKYGGHSLIIRGGPGTGKTTFALQLLEEIVDPEKSFYLSTRVSDEALFTQFSWLKGEEMRRRILSSSRLFLDALYQKQEKTKKRKKKDEEKEIERVAKAKEFLRTIGKVETTKVDRSRFNELIQDRKMPEIEFLYDKIEKILPEKALVVIDSVEGVTQKYNVDAPVLISALQKDLVENSNTNIVMTIEGKIGTDVEYLVDGVISLGMGEIEGRRFRGLHLVKLRATQIHQPYYLVTLQGGRFRCFESSKIIEGESGNWTPLADPTGHFSTGIGALDEILGGGFREGSYNVIEGGENVSIEEFNLILRCIIMNFISHDRGMIAVMTGGVPPEIMREDISRFIGEDNFDTHVRVADYFLLETDKPYIMALGMKKKEDGMRIWMENLSALRGTQNKPLLDFTGFDTVEYLKGGDVAIKDLFSGVGRIKISGDLGVGIIRPGLKLKQEIMNMADTYFKIVDINKYPCIYGIKPKTMIYAIVTDEKKGFPNVTLVPIV